MCDRIRMPDGRIIEFIDEADNCLCSRSQKEILTHIIQNIQEFEIGQELTISRDPFGYVVRIKDIEAI